VQKEYARDFSADDNLEMERVMASRCGQVDKALVWAGYLRKGEMKQQELIASSACFYNVRNAD
jgi:hypothetical protein